MKIVEIKHIEDCFDGSYIKELLFDNVITKEIIFSLKDFGDFNYYETFAKPFFKICNRNIQIKGVEGSQSIRVLIFEETEFNKLINILRKEEEF